MAYIVAVLEEIEPAPTILVSRPGILRQLLCIALNLNHQSIEIRVCRCNAGQLHNHGQLGRDPDDQVCQAECGQKAKFNNRSLAGINA